NKKSICWKSVKTWLGQRTLRRIVMVTTGCHGICHPILMQFLLLLSSLPSTAGMMDHHKHNGPSGVSISITLELLEFGYWDYFSDLHDEPARMDRHGYDGLSHTLHPTLGQTSPSSFSSCTTMPPTDCHRHDGP
ncbi:hypothetical protein EJD97_003113, partial [Solanum chilense]